MQPIAPPCISSSTSAFVLLGTAVMFALGTTPVFGQESPPEPRYSLVNELTEQEEAARQALPELQRDYATTVLRSGTSRKNLKGGKFCQDWVVGSFGVLKSLPSYADPSDKGSLTAGEVRGSRAAALTVGSSAAADAMARAQASARRARQAEEKASTVVVLQVIGKDDALVYDQASKLYWLDGFDTADWTDGEEVDLKNMVVFVAGTKTYENGVGVSRKIPHLSRVVPREANDFLGPIVERMDYRLWTGEHPSQVIVGKLISRVVRHGEVSIRQIDRRRLKLSVSSLSMQDLGFLEAE